MSTMTQTGTALMPTPVNYVGETIDMSIPQSVCLAETIPEIASALGRLDPSSVSGGFEITTSGGRKLSQSKSLSDQNVQAGVLLTLEPIGQSAKDLRYDDLIEAVGSSVDQDSKERTPTDSLQLSSHATAALILVTALLLTLGPEHGYLSTAIGIIGAPLVVAASAIIIRVSPVVGVVSLFATASLLMMSVGFNPAGGGWWPITWLAGGVGILVAAASALVPPSRIRAIMAAPLVVGITMVPSGVIGVSTAIPLEKTTSLAFALPLIISFSVPWFALAQVPVKVMGPTPMASIGIYEVHGKVSTSQAFVVVVKTGVPISLGSLVPMLLNSPEAIILLGCPGVALMLTTRSLRSRLEVLIGVIIEMLLILSAMFSVARSHPAMAPSIVIAALTVVVCLPAANAVNARTRPWLIRAANVLSIIVPLTILPLTVTVRGVIWCP